MCFTVCLRITKNEKFSAFCMNCIEVFNKNVENIKIESNFEIWLKLFWRKRIVKNGGYRNENLVKILSDSYKIIAVLVRKNGEKWGYTEMKIRSDFEPRLNCARAVAPGWIVPERCILHYSILINDEKGPRKAGREYTF